VLQIVYSLVGILSNSQTRTTALCSVSETIVDR
jgi:hypothetical protein